MGGVWGGVLITPSIGGGFSLGSHNPGHNAAISPSIRSLVLFPLGLSPRIRGESGRHLCRLAALGIIPANTGRILPGPAASVSDRDHPREYGENCSTVITPACNCGSSPRIRGEYLWGFGEDSPIGIIPANTGRISSKSRSVQAKGDHPREYGENSITFKALHPHGGSSPRIRGEFFLQIVDQFLHRIIPANTGRIHRP